MGTLNIKAPFWDYAAQLPSSSGINLQALHKFDLLSFALGTVVSVLLGFALFKLKATKGLKIAAALIITFFVFLSVKTYINTPELPYKGLTFRSDINYYLPLTWLKLWTGYLLCLFLLSVTFFDAAKSDQNYARLHSIKEAINKFSLYTGKTIAWLALFMVFLQALIVVLRYIFSLSFIFLQEGMVYLHAFLFLGAAGYTLWVGGHVRVDVFYREAPKESKAITDLAGSILFLFPVCALIWAYSFGYVSTSWEIMEGSIEKEGIQFRYLLKSMILVFCALISIQGVSLAFSSILTLAQPDRTPDDDFHDAHDYCASTPTAE